MLSDFNILDFVFVIRIRS